ncbi:MAG: hypothetical protein WDN24_12100 [Sphingomonas sp.]
MSRSRRSCSTRSTSTAISSNTTPTARAASSRCASCPGASASCWGWVTTKKPALESKDELKRRIDEAAKFVPLEQLALSPQCGFSSGIGGNTMTIEDEMAKLRLVVEVATEVWGEA